MLGRQLGGMRPAECKGRVCARAASALEHDEMRRQRPLGAARHHQAHRGGLIPRKDAGEHGAERGGGKAAGEIIDEAVALGLAEDRDNAGRVDAAFGNGGLDAAHVIRTGGGDPVHSGLRHGGSLQCLRRY
jgi:hypothetical protein